MDELLKKITGKSLNFATPINDRSYGIVGANLITEFAKKGISVALFGIPGNKHLDVRFNPALELPIQEIVNNTQLNINAPSLRLWHQFDIAPRLSKNKHVAYTIFELDTFTPQEKSQIESVDHLCVCSKWAASVIKKETNQTNVSVVPLGVDLNIFHPIDTNPNTNYIFLNIGKIEFRKGHDVLVDIFNQAFTPKDNVELWIAWTNPFLNQQETKEWVDLYRNSKMGRKIRFVPWLQTHEELATLINHTDCGIFPSRAEGFNLPALEMLACNKPIIVTNYSAHTEYCNSDNASLINGNDIETAYDGKWFFSQGNWLSIENDQIEQAVHYMRTCYKYRIKTNIKGLETAKQLTWENTASLLTKVIYDDNTSYHGT